METKILSQTCQLIFINEPLRMHFAVLLLLPLAINIK